MSVDDAHETENDGTAQSVPLEGGEPLYPGRWWHREGDRFRCDLCPRRCLVSPGQRAYCFVRVGTPDGIALSTYGRSSGFCVDPIEKKPLNHFHPGTSVLSFGTAGCNLGCRFCQNFEISTAREMDTLAAEASPQKIATVARELGCRSVAFTYNDPVIFAEYAIDTAYACRAAGLHPVAVTAGYITAEARPEFYAAMDAANIDLKAFSEEFYRRTCLGRLADVCETIEYVVKETSCWVELTTLLIPGLNDSDPELHALSSWVAERLGPEVPLHFTAFHPDNKMLDRPPTPLSTLRRAREIARGHGLRYVYTGNASDVDGQSTWCPTCGARAIERDRYRIGRWRLAGAYHSDTGACAACGAAIPGHFDAAPGRWGARRLPIHMA